MALQAQQCRQRMIALLCFNSSQLTTQEDIASMVCLLVLIHHGHVFVDDPQLRSQLATLATRCRAVMAHRLPAVLRVASAAPQAVLTAAVACVLQRTPAFLGWKQWGSTASFEAVAPGETLYSINVADGTVLLDGSPPSRLPKDIRAHPLYVRTFGAANFEVAALLGGVLQTVKPVSGRFYDFFLGPGAQGF